MRPIVFSIFILFIIALLVVPAIAGIFECGHDNEEERTGYPYDASGDTLKTKVIYVGFHGGQDSTLVPEFKAAVDTLKWFFNSHSHGRLQYSDDSGIVLRPGQSFGDPENPPIAWMADLSAAEYRAPFVAPADYAYTGLTDSWYSTTQPGAALNAEILYKIQAAYPANTDLFADTDRLVINYLTPSPGVFIYGVGGRAHVYINLESMPSYFDFRIEFSDMVYGSQQNTNFEDGATTWDAADVAYPMAHEAAHGLGPDDGPPNFLTADLSEGRYYYGNLNLMDQRRSEREGLPPIGIGWLQDIPWQEGGTNGVYDFTGQAFRDTVFDIRSPKGKIYKFRIESNMCLNTPLGSQYFLIAYHAGTGIDGVVSVDGEPLMRSTGLEIMHCERMAMFDLESAFGMFSDPSVNEFNMDPGYWTNMDTESGYDNHDWWDISPGNQRDGDEYGEYIGDKFDFFRINLAGADTVFNKAVFSFDSNPNCFAYGPSMQNMPFRRKPQNIPNSMRVKIIEQNDDEGWMIVDFATAPYGKLLYPDESAGLTFSVGDTINVRWSNDFGDDIDRVDVMFFPFNDGIPQILASDLAVSSQDTIFPWVVGPESVSSGGKLKVVFKNPYTRYGIADSTIVVVDGDLYPAETIITPTVGSEFFTGRGNRVTWTKRFRSFPADTLHETSSVDFLFSAEGGADGTWDTLAVDLTFEELEDYNLYQWSPDLEMQTTNGKIRLVFHTKGGDIAIGESDVAFLVFPLGALFGDSTGRVGELKDYSGQPYSGVSLDFNQDKKLDLFVSIHDPGNGIPGSPVLYENRMPDIGGLPLFIDVNDIAFLPPPPALSLGVAMGDIDQDGYEDLFLTNENTAHLYHFDGGIFVDALASYFPYASADSLLEKTSCATWVDFDHDGDLDLYLGRLHRIVNDFGDPEYLPLQDAFFMNQGPGSNYSFVEIGEQIGLIDSLVVGATQTVIWSDIDGDHLWEVFVGDSAPYDPQNRMYVQLPDANFERLSSPFPVSLGAIEAAKLVDVDNSGTFELVLKNDEKRLYILDGFQAGFAVCQVLESPGFSNNLGVLDYDLDSWVDFLLPGSKIGSLNTLWVNLQGNSIFDALFLDFSSKVGISDPDDKVGGLVAADFTGDGDWDLFLGACLPSGNSSADGRYFQNRPTGLGDAPANHWLGIRLTNCESDLTTNLGAVVTITRNLGGVILGMQQLDGGSGRGGQADRNLIFGLGSYGDNPGDAVSVEIDWPNGENMDFQVFAADLDSVIEITKNTEFSIDTSSVRLKTIFDIHQTDKLDFSFSWVTDGLTKWDMDEVHLTPVSGSSCPFGPVTLTKGSPSVVVQEPKYKIDAATGESYYEHLLVWEDIDCLTGCSFNYSVHSSTGCRTDSYAKPRPFTILVCPSSN